jgi:hypothetical protein
VDITSLSIDPPSATIEVDQTTPKTQTFTATGKLKDGSTQKVAATFSVDNALPGKIDASSGLYTTSNDAGGLVHVEARRRPPISP